MARVRTGIARSPEVREDRIGAAMFRPALELIYNRKRKWGNLIPHAGIFQLLQ
jgi:hypothetical protein